MADATVDSPPTDSSAEVKAKKPSAKKAKGPQKVVEAPADIGKRERKPAQQFQLSDERTTHEVVFEKGKGKALADIPNLEHTLFNSSDPKLLSTLHRVCFKSNGTKPTRKRNLKKFNGTLEDLESVKQRLSHRTKNELSAIANSFDCRPDSNDKDDLVDAVAGWLKNPHSSGKEVKHATKRKRSSSPGKKSSKKKKTKRSKKDPDAPKRPMTAYLFFCNDQRPELKKKHSDASLGELSKICSVHWKKLSDKEKKPFEKKAVAAKEKYEKEKKEYKKKSSSKKKKESEEEESGSEASAAEDKESEASKSD
jgi:hypothetical protein